jgi:hypothetical protein
MHPFVFERKFASPSLFHTSSLFQRIENSWGSSIQPLSLAGALLWHSLASFDALWLYLTLFGFSLAKLDTALKNLVN